MYKYNYRRGYKPTLSIIPALSVRCHVGHCLAQEIYLFLALLSVFMVSPVKSLNVDI